MAYNSRSRAAAQQQTPPWVPTAVAIITSTIGLALLYFGLPGFVVVWLGLTVAAWSAVPPLMTGKDPATKAPIPQGPREEKQYQQFQFWRSLKWGLVFPVSSAWPGIPPRAAFFGSLLTAATAACLPAFDLPAQYPALLLPVANALFAFITVSQLCAARRDTVAKSDRSPGVKFHHVLRIGYSDKTGLTDTKVRAAFLGGGFLAGVVSAVAAHLYAPAPAWLPGFLAAAAWPLIGFCSGFAAVTARPWVDVSLEHWRMVGAARDEWAPRWTMLKQQAAPPRLNDRQFCGPAVIDSFTADGMMGGSNTYLALAQKIIPTMGRSVRLAVLPSPSRDSSGQPMPGTIDANDFQIVVWPADFQVSLADPSVDPDLAKLWLECALAWVCEGLSLPPIVDQMTPLGVPSESAPVFLIDPDTEEPVTDPETGEPVIDPNAPVTTTDIESQAYAITLHMPAGPGYETMRKMLIGPLAGWCGAEALCDHRGGALYVGALTEGQPEFDPSTGVTVEALRQLDTEDTWNTRWAAVLKQDVNPPTIDFRTTTEEAILGGAVIKRQAFIPRQGVDLRDFFNLEPKIAATIAGAPFVYVSGWIQSAQPNGRKGERHAQAFQVCWSNAALPPNPDELRPLSAPPRPGDPGSRGRNPRDPRDPRNPRDPRGARGPAGQAAPMPAHNNAYLWLLGGRISQAFRAARLAQPETYAIRCLTSPRSRGHIWACSVRLYDGVTLADVRGAAQRLRQAIGSEWLRVEALDDGCTIVVGASPSRVTLADPERDTRYLANLDWQQAFLDSKVSGVGGLTPEVISVETLPANPQVSCTTFTLPSGLSMADVSAQKAKLETATGNAFIEVRESARGLATEMRILSSEVNPMPEQAPVDFEFMDTADGIPFATGVEGEPLIFDPKDSPHALLAGVTGAGKAQPLNTRLPVPVSPKFPTGWALLRDIEVGDEVYALDGSVTTVTTLSPITHERTFRFHFSDGRTVDSGANHLWKVSTRTSRRDYTQRKVKERDTRYRARMERVAALRAKATDVGPQLMMTLPDIAEMAGIVGKTTIYQLPLSLEHLDFPMLKQVNKPAKVYDVEALASLYEKKTYKVAGVEIGAAHIECLREAGRKFDGWLTVLAAADALLSEHSSRDAQRAVRRLVNHFAVPHKDGLASVTLTVYPVDEVLTQIADYLEATAPADGQTGARPIMELVSTLEMAERGVDERFATPETPAISGSGADLPLDPYVLGAWLGDGTQRNGGITSADLGIIEQVQAAGFRLMRVEDRADQGLAKTYHFKGLVDALRDSGIPVHRLTGVQKRIPAAFLRASYEQRLALLQGLMDTDGTIDNEHGKCELAVSDAILADDALHLVRSLGIRASRSIADAFYRDENGDLVECKKRHRIHFTPSEQVFRLPRKAERSRAVTGVEGRNMPWAYIDRIEELPAQAMRCIAVAHPAHVYLTDDLVPTHNSVLITNFVYGFLLRGADVYVIDPVKGGADFAWAREHCRAFATTPFEAAGLLKNVIYAEVVRRKNLASQHGVASYLDLPEKLPPIVVVLDEFTSLMGRAPVPPASDDPEAEAERALLIAENTARANIGTFTGKLAREARSAGVTVLLGTQKLSAKMLDSVPGGSDLKDLSLDTRLPVPVSDRFPTGWATVAELVEGDLLYAPDGSQTNIIGFSEVFTDNDVYEVTFDDGQVIKAGADHGWWAAFGSADDQVVKTTDMLDAPSMWSIPASEAIPGRYEPTVERHHITSIEKIEPVPTRCIAVNHPSHLFLAEGFIPTHNTNLARVLLGNASYGDRSSAFRSPDMAPQLTGAIPKGRGLWESLSASAAVMAQTWYAPPTVLGAELLKRKPPLDPSQIVDMSDFGPPELDVTGAIITDSGLTEVTPGVPATPGPAGPVEEVSPSLDELTSFATEEVIEEEVVLDLGDLVEFLDEDALDDLLPVSRTGGLNADDFGVDFSDVNVVDEPVTVETPIADDAAAVPAAPAVPSPAIPADPESEPFDWDAAEAAADEDDDEDTFAGFDLQEAAPVPTPAPSPVVDEPVSAPVADAPEAAIPADPDVVAVGSSVIWDEIDPTPWEPADGTGEYFWTEIDALMAFLDAYPHVMQVTWTDPLLFSEDPIGVRMIDIVADLGEERGVSLILPDEPTTPPVAIPPPAPAPPVTPVSVAPAQPALATNLPEDVAETSQPPAAPPQVAAHPPATPAPAVTSSDDEFDSIKRVPPHLLPTDNPFE